MAKAKTPKQAQNSLKKITKKNKKKLKSFKPTKKVYVGLPSSSGNHDTGESIVEIGATHEFGRPNKGIPKRSFLREPLSRNKQVIRDKSKELISKAFRSNKGLDSTLEELGELGISISVDSFTNNDWDPINIREDGSSTPLIHTGTLRRSITKEIR